MPLVLGGLLSRSITGTATLTKLLSLMDAQQTLTQESVTSSSSLAQNSLPVPRVAVGRAGATGVLRVVPPLDDVTSSTTSMFSSGDSPVNLLASQDQPARDPPISMTELLALRDSEFANHTEKLDDATDSEGNLANLVPVASDDSDNHHHDDTTDANLDTDKYLEPDHPDLQTYTCDEPDLEMLESRRPTPYDLEADLRTNLGTENQEVPTPVTTHDGIREAMVSPSLDPLLPISSMISSWQPPTSLLSIVEMEPELSFKIFEELFKRPLTRSALNSNTDCNTDELECEMGLQIELELRDFALSNTNLLETNEQDRSGSNSNLHSRHCDVGPALSTWFHKTFSCLPHQTQYTEGSFNILSNVRPSSL